MSSRTQREPEELLECFSSCHAWGLFRQGASRRTVIRPRYQAAKAPEGCPRNVVLVGTLAARELVGGIRQGRRGVKHSFCGRRS